METELATPGFDHSVDQQAPIDRVAPGATVSVISPGGAVLESHPLPVNASMRIAFGDAGLDSLHVTTADGRRLRARATGRRSLGRNGRS